VFLNAEGDIVKKLEKLKVKELNRDNMVLCARDKKY
jgi:hypothetical protein